ncbi:unnamed protein product [Moneuplotes crassus]|uniref:Uncharacterized protein n=1 Tax=Euplotes crassus TaxID=5936 RepID=A0AAD1XJ05_EUPCR|nr:unnamed protein product [Moneuplotes crassus]
MNSSFGSIPNSWLMYLGRKFINSFFWSFTLDVSWAILLSLSQWNLLIFRSHDFMTISFLFLSPFNSGFLPFFLNSTVEASSECTDSIWVGSLDSFCGNKLKEVDTFNWLFVLSLSKESPSSISPGLDFSLRPSSYFSLVQDSSQTPKVGCGKAFQSR